MTSTCRAARAASSSTCTVPRLVWEPEAWQVPHYQPSLPRVGHGHLERVCSGVRLHVVRPEWQKLAERSRWESGGQRKYALALNSGVDRADARAHCIAALSSFRPRICSRHDVFVWGQAKTLFSPARGTVVLHNNEGGTNVSKLNLGPRSGVLKSSQPWMCKAANATAALNSTPAVFGPCGGHAVIGRNPMGVGYFHTVFESLGSLAFLLEYARRPDRHGGAVRVLDNMCIPAVGGQNKAPMGGRICPHGPSPGFVRGFFEFLGINATQLQHYPWVRQTAGPPSFLDRATFDCSQTPFRHFWHALKLRAELHARFAEAAPPRDVVVLVDRSSCKGGPFCKKARGVGRQKEIEAAVAARLRAMPGGLSLQVFQGERWGVAEQARLFRRAAAMVGPHGAGEVNMLFLQPRTPVVEYVWMHALNSALYVGFAHAFNLPYWAVASNATDGSFNDISPEDVADTVASAVQGHNHSQKHSVLAEWSTNVIFGYGYDPLTPPGWLADSYLHQGRIWY